MQKLSQVEVANLTRGTVLGSEIRLADTALSRMIGLLRNSELHPGCGLLIAPSSGVHTFGMRFPIDIVALDRHFRVRGVWENVGPFRIAAVGLKTHQVLELPVGAIRESHTQVNDQLVLHHPEASGGLSQAGRSEEASILGDATSNPAEMPNKGERV
jgi:hypothetical protein